jgi:hypothetical protein
MPRSLRSIAALVVLLSACGGACQGASESTDASHPRVEPAAPGSAEALALPPGVETNTGRFATATVCARCHASSADADAMRESSGATVAFYDLWRSTMMAQSARDPFFRAVVSAEAAANPAHAEEIRRKCMTCHTPMAATESTMRGEQASWDQLASESDLGNLARDGVSCTVCHQIRPDGLGTEASYSGGYVIADRAELFGPHEGPFAMPMIRQSGFAPVTSDHVTDSALCGSCHTLETRAFDDEGEATSFVLPEQTPYLEWRNSVFDGEEAASCQSCHVPTADSSGHALRTAIARNPGGFDFPPVRQRSPVGRHVFVGGNTYMLTLLRDWTDLLQTGVPAAAFDRTIALTREQLRTRTAELEVTTASRTQSGIELRLALRNLTGHKFPTGHPARRAWLHVEATDAEGQVVFRSGAHDAAGRIVGPSGAPLATEAAGGPFQPHRDVMASGDEPYVLESSMAKGDGELTYLLLTGARYIKDNRLLPRGWRDDHPDITRIVPIGTEGDDSFAAGGDTVTYRFSAPAGKVTIVARLLYQSLSARYVAELFSWDTPEVRGFRTMWESSDRTPEEIAAATVIVD